MTFYPILSKPSKQVSLELTQKLTVESLVEADVSHPFLSKTDGMAENVL